MTPTAIPSAAINAQESAAFSLLCFAPGAPSQNSHSLSSPTPTPTPTAQWPLGHDPTRRSMQALISQSMGIRAAPAFNPSITSTRNLVDEDVLQHVKTSLLLEAVQREKNLLVQRIMHRQYQENALVRTAMQPSAWAFSTQAFHQPINPSTTRLVELIGSQIRAGHAYIDVTKLAGIDQAEAVPPRFNRGGQVETFPEVSTKQRQLLPTFIVFSPPSLNPFRSYIVC
jgi:hypothetical protein